MSGGPTSTTAPCHLAPFDEHVEPLAAFLERLEMYFLANDVQEEKKAATLLSLIGPRFYTILRESFAPEKPMSKSYSEIVEILKVPEPIEIAERYRFYTRKQGHSETITEYLNALKKVSQHCNFGSLDETLRDQLVCGMGDREIQKHLLGERTLTLSSALAIATSMEKKRPQSSRPGATGGTMNSRIGPGIVRKGPRPVPEKTCFRCGEVGHIKHECTKKDISCDKCGRPGHIAIRCTMSFRSMRGNYHSRMGMGHNDRGGTESSNHNTNNYEELGGRHRNPYNVRQIPPKTSRTQQNFDYFLVLDFEATCDERKNINPQEIIEFPVLKINAETYDIEATFHKFVRPLKHPTLTDFCARLLPITQDEIDGAEPFPEVFTEFSKWMQDEVGLDKNFLFVTCGDWDLKTMLPSQCSTSDLQIPPYCKKWLNIKKTYAMVTGQFNRSMMSMIQSLDIPHEGKHHSGIDDCQNIANILRELADRGAKFLPTMNLE